METGQKKESLPMQTLPPYPSYSQNCNLYVALIGRLSNYYIDGIDVNEA